jgi:polyisoprenoid-binding protein YceI
LVALLVLSFAAAHAANYRIEPNETTAGFEVWLIGFIPIRGHFKHTSGVLRYDSGARTGYIEVAIDTSTLEADSPRAQATARGPAFFNVEKYPRVEFKSSRFLFEGERLHTIEGTLTLTGTTQPVTLAVNDATCKAATASERSVCRAEAVLTVKRSAFGMKAWAHSVGDDVTIRIALVAHGEQPDAKPPRTSPVDASSAPGRE